MGIDHCGVEIRVPHEFLNGSDILPTLQQMGRERMAERVATCRFGEAGAFNGLLHGLLDQTWIYVVAALLSRGRVLPAVSLGKHPLPAPLPIGMAVLSRQGMGQDHRSPTSRQILLMEAANMLEMPFQSLALASGQQRKAILAAFAIPHCQHSPLKIQILHSYAQCLQPLRGSRWLQTKPTSIQQSHHQSWFSLQLSPHRSRLRLVQHHRQPPLRPCPDHPLQIQISFQQLPVQKQQRR